MSKYHAQCTNPQPPAQPDKCGGNLTRDFKPLCDCERCMCEKCPDILKQLSTSDTEYSCDFDSEVSEDTKTLTCSEHNLGRHQSLLAVINGDRDCICGIVANAVRSHMHMNLTLTERRETIKINSENSEKTSDSEVISPGTEDTTKEN